MITLFIIAYLAIACEQWIGVNKAAIALLLGVGLWVLLGFDANVSTQLSHHFAGISEILFFLLGAMTIVELIDAHDGFNIITEKITSTSSTKLLCLIAFISFFLSAFLDNLTTTIVMISVVRKLIQNTKQRWYFVSLIIISANAGGAGSPIGDVTTSMLWIGHQITELKIIKAVFLPSIIHTLVPLTIFSLILKGPIQAPIQKATEDQLHIKLSRTHQLIVLCSGILILIAVPIFKIVTHLPPYMGMLFGLGVLWLITEILHGKKDEEDRNFLSVIYALRKIDTPSILFFLGILLSIAALESAGVLQQTALAFQKYIPNNNSIVFCLGLISAVIDNVPLVAAAQGMYPLQVHATDSFFWHFLAYCSGTGGSILIIGSAAGVVAMGLEKISFMWYLKHIAWVALLAYILGAVCCIWLN